jgi:flagellar secretion chaperone FliS
VIRDPYQAYVENGVLGSGPVQLVITMYEAAITRTQDAIACLESGDVWGRARAISKAGNILAELIASLNPEVGRDIGINLDRLYHYMQRRLQEAHFKKTVEPLIEVEKLLKQLLEAWYKVAEAERAAAPVPARQNEARLENTSSNYPGSLIETDAAERLGLSA